MNLLNINDMNGYPTITGIYEYNGESGFYSSENEYLISEITNKLYRIEYIDKAPEHNSLFVTFNIVLVVFTLIIFSAFIYIRQELVKPFNELNNLPEQLSKGNLVLPLKEHKSRFFGKFVLGLDMLRQEFEHSRQKELEYRLSAWQRSRTVHMPQADGADRQKHLCRNSG